VTAREVRLPTAELRALQRQIMLFYTGITRSANTILAEQNANIESTRPSLDLLRDLTALAVERLDKGDTDAIGPAIRESWEAKRKLAAGVSNASIDAAVTAALDAGASGVKITGAGGGGFVLVLCDMEYQRAVRQALSYMQELPIRLDPFGSRVVLNVVRDIWS
jgi:D-glycero-alpha-D-manno-heptose-7-phosphate kinase